MTETADRTMNQPQRLFDLAPDIVIRGISAPSKKHLTEALYRAMLAVEAAESRTPGEDEIVKRILKGICGQMYIRGFITDVTETADR